MKGKFNIRLEMVEYARKQGIKATARAFKVTRPIIKKWCTRYKDEGLDGLRDRSRAPNNQWMKCEPEFEKLVIKYRLQTKNKFGAMTLKRRFGLERSANCINRIIKENPKCRRKKKKVHEKRNELRSVKRFLKAFELIQVDVKELMDISNYYVQQWKCKELPKYEITARDVKTGATWICLSDTKESINTASFIAMLMEHFQKHGFDIKNINIQTDNGREFHNRAGEALSSFDKVLEKYQVNQHRIPPAAPTFNSDVETFHRLCEDEFYSIERYSGLDDMLKQTYTYMIDFNYLRTNSYKENKTPYQLLKEDYPAIDPNILNFPIVKVDNFRKYYLELCGEKDTSNDFYYDPMDYLLFHGIDPDDHQGGYHVSSFHRISYKLLQFL